MDQNPIGVFAVRQLSDGSWILMAADGSTICNKTTLREFRARESGNPLPDPNSPRTPPEFPLDKPVA